MSDQATVKAPADPTLVHAALLYSSAGQLGDVVREFVADARAAAEPVLAVLPVPSRELVAHALGDAAHQVRFEDMSELGRNPSCLLSVYEDWIEEHDGPVRVIGESVWAERSYAEIVECLRHEALVNHALASTSVSLLCPYDAQRLDASALEGAELTHPQIIEDGGRRPSARYGEPLEVHAGDRWPQAEASEPVSEHVFAGDLHALRRAVATDPIASTLDQDRLSDLVLAVNEAATNAVKHGDGTGTARLWKDGSSVVSEVTTSTVILDPLVGRRRPDPEAASGRGLWLINQICDLVELRTGGPGTALRMHLRAPEVAIGSELPAGGYDAQMTELAFLGTGTMGLPMARNLTAAGFKVRAWNRTIERARPLAGDGAQVLDDPRAAATGCSTLITMLSDGDAVLEAAERSLPGLEPAGTWVQMSTIGIEATDRCVQLAQRADATFVDAPVLGTREPAQKGQLVILGSGPDDARAFCQPVFDAVGAKTVWLGEAGAGSRAKVVVNAWIVGVVAVLAETIRLAEALELDPELFFAAVADGPLDLPYARLKGSAMISSSFDDVSFRLSLSRKDGDLVLAAAAEAGIELPVMTAVLERLRAAEAAGHGDKDMAATYLVDPSDGARQ